MELQKAHHGVAVDHPLEAPRKRSRGCMPSEDTLPAPPNTLLGPPDANVNASSRPRPSRIGGGRAALPCALPDGARASMPCGSSTATRMQARGLVSTVWAQHEGEARMRRGASRRPSNVPTQPASPALSLALTPVLDLSLDSEGDDGEARCPGGVRRGCDLVLARDLSG